MEQFHEEKGTRKSVISLGRWNRDKHLEWLERNPDKRPKKGKTPKMVSHFYGDGDVCPETGKPRHVEVKLKCKYSDAASGASDTVSLYLLEPQTCNYILGVRASLPSSLHSHSLSASLLTQVESPFLCRLLNSVDANGLIDGLSKETSKGSSKEEL